MGAAHDIPLHGHEHPFHDRLPGGPVTVPMGHARGVTEIRAMPTGGRTYGLRGLRRVPMGTSSGGRRARIRSPWGRVQVPRPGSSHEPGGHGAGPGRSRSGRRNQVTPRPWGPSSAPPGTMGRASGASGAPMGAPGSVRTPHGAGEQPLTGHFGWFRPPPEGPRGAMGCPMGRLSDPRGDRRWKGGRGTAWARGPGTVGGAQRLNP